MEKGRIITDREYEKIKEIINAIDVSIFGLWDTDVHQTNKDAQYLLSNLSREIESLKKRFE